MGSGASSGVSPIPSPRRGEADRRSPLKQASLSKRQVSLLESDFNPFLEGLVVQGLHMSGLAVVKRSDSAVLFSTAGFQLSRHAFKTITHAMHNPKDSFWDDIEVNGEHYATFFASRHSLHAKGPRGLGGMVAMRGSGSGTLTVATFRAPTELSEVVITTAEIVEFVDNTLL